jgi:hypothetical protein
MSKQQISKTKETTAWNCSVCKINIHLYASIVCDGCLEWNHLKRMFVVPSITSMIFTSVFRIKLNIAENSVKR